MPKKKAKAPAKVARKNLSPNRQEIAPDKNGQYSFDLNKVVLGSQITLFDGDDKVATIGNYAGKIVVDILTDEAVNIVGSLKATSLSIASRGIVSFLDKLEVQNFSLKAEQCSMDGCLDIEQSCDINVQRLDSCNELQIAGCVNINTKIWYCYKGAKVTIKHTTSEKQSKINIEDAFLSHSSAQISVSPSQKLAELLKTEKSYQYPIVFACPSIHARGRLSLHGVNLTCNSLGADKKADYLFERSKIFCNKDILFDGTVVCKDSKIESPSISSIQNCTAITYENTFVRADVFSADGNTTLKDFTVEAKERVSLCGKLNVDGVNVTQSKSVEITLSEISGSGFDIHADHLLLQTGASKKGECRELKAQAATFETCGDITLHDSAIAVRGGKISRNYGELHLENSTIDTDGLVYNPKRSKLSMGKSSFTASRIYNGGSVDLQQQSELTTKVLTDVGQSFDSAQSRVSVETDLFVSGQAKFHLKDGSALDAGKAQVLVNDGAEADVTDGSVLSAQQLIVSKEGTVKLDGAKGSVASELLLIGKGSVEKGVFTTKTTTVIGELDVTHAEVNAENTAVIGTVSAQDSILRTKETLTVSPDGEVNLTDSRIKAKEMQHQGTLTVKRAEKRQAKEIGGSGNTAEKRFTLHFMLVLPEAGRLDEYGGSYIFADDKAAKNLYYVNPKGRSKNIPINDMEKFVADLPKDRETQKSIQLTKKQLVALIASRGAHFSSDKELPPVPTLKVKKLRTSYGSKIVGDFIGIEADSWEHQGSVDLSDGLRARGSSLWVEGGKFKIGNNLDFGYDVLVNFGGEVSSNRIKIASGITANLFGIIKAETIDSSSFANFNAGMIRAYNIQNRSLFSTEFGLTLLKLPNEPMQIFSLSNLVKGAKMGVCAALPEYSSTINFVSALPGMYAAGQGALKYWQDFDAEDLQDVSLHEFAEQACQVAVFYAAGKNLVGHFGSMKADVKEYLARGAKKPKESAPAFSKMDITMGALKAAATIVGPKIDRQSLVDVNYGTRMSGGIYEASLYSHNGGSKMGLGSVTVDASYQHNTGGIFAGYGPVNLSGSLFVNADGAVVGGGGVNVNFDKVSLTASEHSEHSGWHVKAHDLAISGDQSFAASEIKAQTITMSSQKDDDKVSYTDGTQVVAKTAKIATDVSFKRSAATFDTLEQHDHQATLGDASHLVVREKYVLRHSARLVLANQSKAVAKSQTVEAGAAITVDHAAHYAETLDQKGDITLKGEATSVVTQKHTLAEGATLRVSGGAIAQAHTREDSGTVELDNGHLITEEKYRQLKKGRVDAKAGSTIEAGVFEQGGSVAQDAGTLLVKEKHVLESGAKLDLTNGAKAFAKSQTVEVGAAITVDHAAQYAETLDQKGDITLKGKSTLVVEKEYTLGEDATLRAVYGATAHAHIKENTGTIASRGAHSSSDKELPSVPTLKVKKLRTSYGSKIVGDFIGIEADSWKHQGSVDLSDGLRARGSSLWNEGGKIKTKNSINLSYDTLVNFGGEVSSKRIKIASGITANLFGIINAETIDISSFANFNAGVVRAYNIQDRSLLSIDFGLTLPRFPDEPMQIFSLSNFVQGAKMVACIAFPACSSAINFAFALPGIYAAGQSALKYWQDFDAEKLQDASLHEFAEQACQVAGFYAAGKNLVGHFGSLKDDVKDYLTASDAVPEEPATTAALDQAGKPEPAISNIKVAVSALKAAATIVGPKIDRQSLVDVNYGTRMSGGIYEASLYSHNGGTKMGLCSVTVDSSYQHNTGGIFAGYGPVNLSGSSFVNADGAVVGRDGVNLNFKKVLLTASGQSEHRGWHVKADDLAISGDQSFAASEIKAQTLTMSSQKDGDKVSFTEDTQVVAKTAKIATDVSLKRSAATVGTLVQHSHQTTLEDASHLVVKEKHVLENGAKLDLTNGAKAVAKEQTVEVGAAITVDHAAHYAETLDQKGDITLKGEATSVVTQKHTLAEGATLRVSEGAIAQAHTREDSGTVELDNGHLITEEQYRQLKKGRVDAKAGSTIKAEIFEQGGSVAQDAGTLLVKEKHVLENGAKLDLTNGAKAVAKEQIVEVGAAITVDHAAHYAETLDQKGDITLKGEATSVVTQKHTLAEGATLRVSEGAIAQAHTREDSGTVELDNGHLITEEQYRQLKKGRVDAKAGSTIKAEVFEQNGRVTVEDSLLKAKVHNVGQSADLEVKGSTHETEKLFSEGTTKYTSIYVLPDKDALQQSANPDPLKQQASVQKGGSIVYAETAKDEKHNTQVEAKALTIKGVQSETNVMIKTGEYTLAPASKITQDTVAVEAATASLAGTMQHKDVTIIATKGDLAFGDGAKLKTEGGCYESKEGLVDYGAAGTFVGANAFKAHSDIVLAKSSSMEGTGGVSFEAQKLKTNQAKVSVAEAYVSVDDVGNVVDVVKARGEYANFAPTGVLGVAVKADVAVKETISDKRDLSIAGKSIVVEKSIETTGDVTLRSLETDIRVSAAVNGRNTTLESARDVAIQAATVRGTNHVEVSAKRKIAVEDEKRITYDKRGKAVGVSFTPGQILGGRGDGFDGVGAHVKADDKVKLQASVIASSGDNVLEAGKGFDFSYDAQAIKEEKTKKSFFKKKTTETTDTVIARSSVASSDGKNVFVSTEGRLDATATDFLATGGNFAQVKKDVGLREAIGVHEETKKKSYLGGIAGSKSYRKDEFAEGVKIFDCARSSFESFEGNIDGKGVNVFSPGKFSAIAKKGTVAFGVTKLNGSYASKSWAPFVGGTAVDLLKVAATRPSMATLLQSDLTLRDFKNGVTLQGSALEQLFASANGTVSAYNAWQEMQQSGLQNTLLSRAGLGDGANFNPRVTLGMSEQETKANFQTASAAVFNVGELELIAGADKDVTLTGVCLDVAGDMNVHGHAFVDQGVALASSFHKVDRAVAVGVNLTGVVDVGASQSSMDVKATTYQYAHGQVGGKLTLDVESVKLDAAVLSAEELALSDRVKQVEVITRQDERKQEMLAGSANTSGAVSFSQSKRTEKMVSEISKLHVHGEIQQEKKLEEIHLVGGIISSDGKDAISAETIHAEKVVDKLRSKTFGLSGNVNDFMPKHEDRLASDVGTAAASDAQESKTIHTLLAVTVGQEKRVVEHLATIAGAAGISVDVQHVEGVLNRNLGAATVVVVDKKQTLDIRAPDVTPFLTPSAKPVVAEIVQGAELPEQHEQRHLPVEEDKPGSVLQEDALASDAALPMDASTSSEATEPALVEPLYITIPTDDAAAGSSEPTMLPLFDAALNPGKETMVVDVGRLLKQGIIMDDSTALGELPHLAEQPSFAKIRFFRPNLKRERLGSKIGYGSESQLYTKKDGRFTSLKKVKEKSQEKNQFGSSVEGQIFSYDKSLPIWSFNPFHQEFPTGASSALSFSLAADSKVASIYDIKKSAFKNIAQARIDCTESLLHQHNDFGIYGQFAGDINLVSATAAVKGELLWQPGKASAEVSAEVGGYGPNVVFGYKTPVFRAFGFKFSADAEGSGGSGLAVSAGAGGAIDAKKLGVSACWKLGLFSGLGARGSLKFNAQIDPKFSENLARNFKNELSDPIRSCIVEDIRSKKTLVLPSWQVDEIDNAADAAIARSLIESFGIEPR